MRLHNSQILRRLWTAMGRPKTYAVGGFVRDRLLGRASGDVDLVLEGDAEAVARPARRLGRHLRARAHLLGTPPRCIWRIDGRDLKVELWPLGDLSLEDDAFRRDFTCNALLWKLPEGPLLDLVGGVADIDNRRLRAVRRDNLERDPVRLLRAARFLAQLDSFELEINTRNWVRELAPTLAEAPRERVGAELLALLRANDASQGITAMLDLCLFQPTAPARVSVDREWMTDHSAAADLLARPSHHPLRAALIEAGDAARLALVLRAWPDVSSRQCSSYGWARHVLRHALRATSLLERARVAAGSSTADRHELIHDAGDALPAVAAFGAALAAAADAPVDPWRRLWRTWKRRGRDLAHPTPLLSAAEITALTGLEPGPELGRLINDLIRAQVRGTIRNPNGARRWLRARSRQREALL